MASTSIFRSGFLLMLAFKIAIIILVIAGLIFKTKEAVSILFVGGVINGFAYHPWIATGLTVAFLTAGAYVKRKEKQKQEVAAMGQEVRLLPPHPDGREF